MSASTNIAIVLLPGMNGSGTMLAELADRLALRRAVRVISYPNDVVLGYDALTSFALERLPDGRFVVLGESFSGPIAIEIAAAAPRAAALILASGFARHPFPPALAPLAQMANLRWLPASLIEALLLGTGGRPDLRKTLQDALASLPREVIRARLSEVLHVDKREKLRALACPMLCLSGRFDRLLGKRSVKEITSVRPECQVRILNAPHMLLQTHAVEAAMAIDDFCDRIGCRNPA